MYWNQGHNSETFVASNPFEVPSADYTRTLGLEVGIFYKFRVSAVNDIGESAISIESPALITADFPSEPLLVQKHSSDANMITISWTAPINENGSGILSYNVWMDGVLVGVK